MSHPYWPLFDLVVRTPRLEIRLPTDDHLVELARLGAAGVHDPACMPFDIPWTDTASPELERSSLQWWWRQRAEWRPESWTFTGAVFVDGVAVGAQDLGARNFSTLGSVVTGSWLGRAHQGRGLGRAMRAAVLHLAFEGLGALEARSGAWHDNPASLHVSRSLGYVESGTDWRIRRGARAQHVGLLLTREAWSAGRHDDIEVVAWIAASTSLVPVGMRPQGQAGRGAEARAVGDGFGSARHGVQERGRGGIGPRRVDSRGASRPAPPHRSGHLRGACGRGLPRACSA